MNRAHARVCVYVCVCVCVCPPQALLDRGVPASRIAFATKYVFSCAVEPLHIVHSMPVLFLLCVCVYA